MDVNVNICVNENQNGAGDKSAVGTQLNQGFNPCCNCKYNKLGFWAKTKAKIRELSDAYENLDEKNRRSLKRYSVFFVLFISIYIYCCQVNFENLTATNPITSTIKMIICGLAIALTFSLMALDWFLYVEIRWLNYLPTLLNLSMLIISSLSGSELTFEIATSMALSLSSTCLFIRNNAINHNNGADVSHSKFDGFTTGLVLIVNSAIFIVKILQA